MNIKSVGLFFIIGIFSCTHEPNIIPDSETATSVVVSNLAADPPTGYDPNTGMPIGEKKLFTFYRLSDSSIVPNADSATSKWDIGFRASTIILNSGISGPGTASGFLMDGIYSSLTSVPVDSIFRQDQTTGLAIGKSWYNYNGAAMIFTPKAGKFLVLKTSDNKYAKLEILNYYKNAPASPNSQTDQARYYKFRYVIQQNGSKNFN